MMQEALKCCCNKIKFIAVIFVKIILKFLLEIMAKILYSEVVSGRGSSDHEQHNSTGYQLPHWLKEYLMKDEYIE